ncbi:MAG: serine hydrolase [Planctomycetota bacterium]
MRHLPCLLALLAAPSFAADPPTRAHMELAASYSADNKGVSLLVLHRGQRIFEDYPGFNGPRSAHQLASGTKSFSGAAAAFAIHEGFLSLDEKVADTITEWAHDPQRSQITVRHLLHLTSGLEPQPEGSRRLRMSYAQAIGARSVTAPGTTFVYGPVHYQVFGELMRRKLEPRGFSSLVDYLEQRLFQPLGLEVDAWKELDGQPVLPHGASLTAREWAKFGEWLRKEGEHEGQQLVPQELIRQLARGSQANPAYGLTFWLNEPVSPKLKREIPLFQSTDLVDHPLVPEDLYMAAGAGDQRLYVIPSLELVVVRQARGMLGAVLGFRSDFSDANLLARLLHGKDADGKDLTP